MSRKLRFVLVIAVGYAMLVWSSAWRQSITCDEVLHLGAGYAGLQSANYGLNPEHPPLAKSLAAVPLYVMQAKYPDLASHPNQHMFGNALLVENKAMLEPMVAWARLPVALMGGFLVAIAGLWAFELYGLWAGVSTALLVGASPEILSHSRWITTDLPLTAFGFLAAFAAWKWLSKPTKGRALWLGLALGAAFGSKFSAVILLPILALLIGCWKASGRPMPGIRDWKVSVPVAVLAAYLLLGLCYSTLNWPALYSQGAQSVNGNHEANFFRYLWGVVRYANFPHYFPTAYLLKTPVPVLLAVAMGIGALFWKRRSPRAERWDAVFFLGAAVTVFAFMMWKADDIGVRYVLPATPFLAMLAGRAVHLWGRRGQAVMALLLVWAVADAGLAWPNLGGYLNELARGPKIEYLDDSNIEWGQGLIALREAMRERGIERINYGGVFYDFIYDPSLYGVAYDRVPEGQRGIVKPGWYAFSPPFLLRSPGFLWLAYRKPIAEVGGLLLYKVEPQDLEQARQTYQELLATKATPWIWCHYGAYEQASGRKVEALKAFDNCLELTPDNLTARDLRAALLAEAPGSAISK